MVKNNNNRTLYETLIQNNFTILMWQLKLELGEHFMVGEWKTIKMQLDSRVIRLLKQEGFWVAIALFYFAENCLDLP